MRFLWLLAVFVALVWLARRAMGSPPRRRPPPAGPDRTGQGPGLPHETMVACEVCRLHLPRGEAVWEADRAFCGEAHRAAFLKGGDSAP